MRTLLLAIFSAALYAQSAATPDALCGLQGRVVNAATGFPVADVKVKLQAPAASGTPAQMGRLAFITMTDDEGNYAFAGIEPGSYTFSAERSGYLKNVYGARRSTPNGAPLRLVRGENRTGMDFKLTPQGVITGRLIQPEGDSPATFTLSAARVAYVNGKRQLSRTSGGFVSDEYRISGLEPGRYYVVAATLPVSGTRNLSGRAPDPFQTTFYPAALDLRDAQVIEVAAGATISGVNIHPVRAPAFTVRGRVVNRSGQELRDFSVMRPPSSALSGEMALSQILGANTQFTSAAVPRGKLTLIAAGINAEGRSISTRHVIEVNEPIENLELTIDPPFSVAGRVRVEGGVLPLGLKVSLARLEEFPDARAARAADVTESGAFTLPDVAADGYFMSVAGLPAGYYVQSIRIGKEDVLESGAELSPKTEGPVEIVVSPKAAAIRGTVTGAAAGVTVALVPQSAKRRARAEFYRSALTDAQGKFSFASIPPGEYKLFAWEDVESGAWTDPDFLKPIELQGKAVTLREGGMENVEVKAIP